MKIDELQELLDKLNSEEINWPTLLERAYIGLKNVLIHQSKSGDEDVLQLLAIHLLEKQNKLKFNTAKEFLSYIHKFSDRTQQYAKYKDRNLVTTDQEELIDYLEALNSDSDESNNPEDMVTRDKDEYDHTYAEFIEDDKNRRVVKPTKERIKMTGLTITEFCDTAEVCRQGLYHSIYNRQLPLDISRKLDKYEKFYNQHRAEYEIRELIFAKLGQLNTECLNLVGIKYGSLLKSFQRGMTYTVFKNYKKMLESYNSQNGLTGIELDKAMKPYKNLLKMD